MNRLESELFDLEELLMRNDGMADDGTYSTIVGIANDVSELEEENAKLRELCGEMLAYMLPSSKRYSLKENMAIIDGFAQRCGELGIEVEE